MGRPKGSKNKHKESEIPIAPKTERPLTTGKFEVRIEYQDHTFDVLVVSTIPRIVENGLLMVISEGYVYSIPISNNIKYYKWKLKEENKND